VKRPILFSAGFVIELAAQPDGSFSVTSTRNGFTQNYSAPNPSAGIGAL
jgi:hypothetical protein